MNRISASRVCAILFLIFLAVPSSARAFSTVVIDAGHGGFDPGGIPGQRVLEKNMALDVALRLQTNLRRAGFRTVMTRASDVFIPLPQRVAIANSQRDAIFVCVHFNSATRAAANGIETYYYSGQSAGLAASIHANVAGGAPSENRGLRRRGYYVLRRNALPAVLVECGFLTNPMEARLAETSSYRQQLANEIARGVRGQKSLGSSFAAGSARQPAVTASSGSGTSFFTEEPQMPARIDHHGTRFLDVAVTAEAEARPARSSRKTRTHHASRSSAHHHTTSKHTVSKQTTTKHKTAKKPASRKKKRT